MEIKRKREVNDLAFVVGTNIAMKRHVLGLSQEQLGERLGIGGDSLSRIEKGLTSPRYARLQAIADALGCHVSELFSDVNASLNIKLQNLASLLESIPLEAQDNLIALMETLVRTFKTSFTK